MALKSNKDTNSNTKIKNKTDDKLTSEKSSLISNGNILKTNTNKLTILSKLDPKIIEAKKQRTTKTHNIHINSECNNFFPSSATMATYYNHYQIPQAYSFPIFSDWTPIVSTVQVSNFYTPPIQPLPVAILTPQVITPICPYTGVIIATEPIPTTIPRNTITTEGMATATNIYSDTYKYDYNYKEEQIQTEVLNDQDSLKSLLPTQIAEMTIDESNKVDPIEFYLSLPKELFPSPKMFAIDPNAIIDEFCKIANMSENVPWILDLEFGVPRVPVTRAIGVYDVKFNSIHCKNTPSAIHPGFEKCNDDFKKVILFYYDCIVSTWYKGYIILNYDKNVENFQSWLLIPMQTLGMCWP